MKVALISFHNALNYGAALQVYALQQSVQALDAPCDYIDYVNDYRKHAYSMIHHIKVELKHKKIMSALKYCVGIPFMSARRRKFKKFYDEKVKYTNKRYTSSKEAEVLNSAYDKFIVGSDQVWNYENNGKDFAFFLDFVKDDNKKISYASSFGLTTIPDHLRDSYIRNLKQINYLSTREVYGVELIKELTGREAELVLDPVFLLHKMQWKALLTNKVSRKPYIFCYTNRPAQLKAFVTQTNYPVGDYKMHKITRHLTVKDFLSPNVKVSYALSPIAFLDSIAHAKLVITASFHCVAMSIILNTPFIAILTGNKGKDERILNLLKIVGLQDRLLNEKMTLDDVNHTIDFEQVEKKVDAYRNKSLHFLTRAIFNQEDGEACAYDL